MSKLGNRIAWVVLGITAAFLLWGIWCLVWPVTPIVYHKNPIPVLNANKSVNAGELLLVDLDFTKYVSVPSRTSRLLKNGLIYNLPDILVQRAPGRYHFTSAMTTIPDELPSGIYTLEYVFSYDVNPLKTVTYTISTEAFSVRAKPTEVEAKQHEILKKIAKLEKRH